MSIITTMRKRSQRLPFQFCVKTAAFMGAGKDYPNYAPRLADDTEEGRDYLIGYNCGWEFAFWHDGPEDVIENMKHRCRPPDEDCLTVTLPPKASMIVRKAAREWHPKAKDAPAISCAP